ncbi:hypothetical protein Tco_0990572 [Tanacetum coccineum]|uniref:Gag-Pol polyprotein n=1 Tax=Tanacetum coccineum TaxID=301880 RepID=A0ABQ5EXM8_9ASTR
MHNNIMAAGSKERPPMLGPGRYSQWRSRFLRYIDTKPNGEGLRKSILSGPYVPSTVLVQAVAATEGVPAVQQHTTIETMEIYSLLKACKTANEMWIAIERLQQGESLNVQDVKTNLFWEFGKFTSREGESMESYYSRFYKLMNELTRNNLQVTTMQVNVQFLQQLQPEWSRFVTVVKQSKEIDTISYHTLFDILKQYQNEVNDIRAERIAKSANPLALLAAAQPYSDNYYQAPKPQRSNTTSSSTRPSASTRHKGKEIAKPVTPQSESVSEEDSDPEQAQRDKDMQKNLALLAKYFKKLYKPTNNNLRTSSNSRNKTEDTTPREQMLLAMKDEAGSNLSNEENDFMLDTSNGEELEELTVVVMLMPRLQPADENAETVPSYDAKVVSQVHASSKVHEQVSLEKRKTIIQIMDDDQIDSNIIFDDPFMENNGGTSGHDSTGHDEYCEIQMLAYNVQRESIQMIHMLGKKPNKVYDPFLKAGLGYTNLVRLKKAVAAQPKMYDGDLIHNNKLLNALYETFVPQQEISAEQTYISISSTFDNGSTSKDAPSESPGPKMPTKSRTTKNELLKVKLDKSASDSRDIQANLLKRIKILENDFQRSQAQSIDFELKLQHQKEKMDCDVSWKAKLSTLHDENVLLKHQVESTVKERENIKLEFQKLFNSIKATRAQHQNEINEMFEDVTQKTYAYADVRAQNQDLLMTISELKSKLKTIDKGKHVNTKFDKSETLGQLLCVTPFNKNLAIKAKNVSNTKVTSDRSKIQNNHFIVYSHNLSKKTTPY